MSESGACRGSHIQRTASILEVENVKEVLTEHRLAKNVERDEARSREFGLTQIGVEISYSFIP